MKERIIEFLKAENKSSAQLAEEIGVQPSGISHIVSGRNNPSLDFVLKMLSRYKYLSTDWLLFGRGSMYKDNSSVQSLFDQTLFDQKPEIQANVDSSPVEPVQAELKDKPNYVPVAQASGKEKSSVDRIVWFYSDGSFAEYYPRDNEVK